MKNWNCEKSRAAYLLSDEIFGALRSVQLADRLLNSMLDFRMDDEEVDATDQYTLRATFKELVWRMDIMCHYLCEARRGASCICLTPPRGSTHPINHPQSPVPSPAMKSLHGSRKSLLSLILPHSSAFWRFSARSRMERRRGTMNYDLLASKRGRVISWQQTSLAL